MPFIRSNFRYPNRGMGAVLNPNASTLSVWDGILNFFCGTIPPQSDIIQSAVAGDFGYDPNTVCGKFWASMNPPAPPPLTSNPPVLAPPTEAPADGQTAQDVVDATVDAATRNAQAIEQDFRSKPGGYRFSLMEEHQPFGAGNPRSEPS